MHIIYKLTNSSKTEGKRFYIGSKQECKFLVIDDIPTIYNMKTGKPYYGSSTCFEFKEDFKRGDVFVAEVLEIVRDREDLRDRENHYLKLYDAVNSEEYYNKSYAFLRTHAHNAIQNKYGELTKEYANSQSQTSKRDGTAIALGYKNFGEMYFALYERLKSGESTKDISESCGKHRKWLQVSLRDYDMEKAKLDLESTSRDELRKLITEGVSLKYAANLLNIELPAARVLLGDYLKEKERAFTVASERGKSKEELEVDLTLRILNGENLLDISNSMTLCRESVLRYFFRCLRRYKDKIIPILEKTE